MNLFIHSFADGHLGCFQFLSITNKAAMNVPVQVFAWTYAYDTLKQIFYKWNGDSYGNYIFNFLR